MITLYPHTKLGRFQTDWLDSRHHFSFGHYFDANRMGFGTLRVINDDLIKAGRGFDLHPHKDMEIITFVRKGAILHRDSLGNEGRTKAGDVQVMSAGTGIHHAEYADPDVDTEIFQIWIKPNKTGVTPRWDAAAFRSDGPQHDLPVLVSGLDDDLRAGALFIHQDARIFGGTLKDGTELVKPVRHQAYVLVSKGQIMLDKQAMNAGDGAEVVDQKTLTIKALGDAEVLIIDL